MSTSKMEDLITCGRVTRSLRKRLESIDSDSCSRPDTPLAHKLIPAAELYSPAKPVGKISRRTSLSGTPAASTPPRSHAYLDYTPGMNTPVRRSTRRGSISGQNDVSYSHSSTSKIKTKIEFDTLKEECLEKDEQTPTTASQDAEIANNDKEIKKRRSGSYRPGPKSKTQNFQSDNNHDSIVIIDDNENKDGHEISSSENVQIKDTEMTTNTKSPNTSKVRVMVQNVLHLPNVYSEPIISEKHKNRSFDEKNKLKIRSSNDNTNTNSRSPKILNLILNSTESSVSPSTNNINCEAISCPNDSKANENTNNVSVVETEKSPLKKISHENNNSKTEEDLANEKETISKDEVTNKRSSSSFASSWTESIVVKTIGSESKIDTIEVEKQQNNDLKNENKISPKSSFDRAKAQRKERNRSKFDSDSEENQKDDESDEDEDELQRMRNSLIVSEAREIDNYESHDSIDSEELKDIVDNEISDFGEPIFSESSIEENDEDDEDDSIVVADSDHSLLMYTDSDEHLNSESKKKNYKRICHNSDSSDISERMILDHSQEKKRNEKEKTKFFDDNSVSEDESNRIGENCLALQVTKFIDESMLEDEPNRHKSFKEDKELINSEKHDHSAVQNTTKNNSYSLNLSSKSDANETDGMDKSHSKENTNVNGEITSPKEGKRNVADKSQDIQEEINEDFRELQNSFVCVDKTTDSKQDSFGDLSISNAASEEISSLSATSCSDIEENISNKSTEESKKGDRSGSKLLESTITENCNNESLKIHNNSVQAPNNQKQNEQMKSNEEKANDSIQTPDNDSDNEAIESINEERVRQNILTSNRLSLQCSPKERKKQDQHKRRTLDSQKKLSPSKSFIENMNQIKDKNEKIRAKRHSASYGGINEPMESENEKRDCLKVSASIRYSLQSTPKEEKKMNDQQKRKTLDNQKVFSPSKSLIENNQTRDNNEHTAKTKRLSKSYNIDTGTKDQIDEEDPAEEELPRTQSESSVDKNDRPGMFNSEVEHIHNILNRCDAFLDAANRAKSEQKLLQKNVKPKKRNRKNKKDSNETDVFDPVCRSNEIKRNEDAKEEIQKAVKASARLLLSQKAASKKKPNRKTSDVVVTNQADIIKNDNADIEIKETPKQLPTDFLDSISREEINSERRKNKSKKQGSKSNSRDNSIMFNVIKSSAGNILETPIEPPKKKKKEIHLPSGIVYEEPGSPVVKKSQLAFRESPITPKSLGFKVRSILTAGQDVPPSVAEKKRKKRKLDISEPVYALPKPVWSQSGNFIEEQLEKSIRPTKSTNFVVSVLNSDCGKERKILKPISNFVNENGMKFKESALANKNIKRESTREIMRRKKCSK